jgi:hypothetical protein
LRHHAQQVPANAGRRHGKVINFAGELVGQAACGDGLVEVAAFGNSDVVPVQGYGAQRQRLLDHLQVLIAVKSKILKKGTC